MSFKKILSAGAATAAILSAFPAAADPITFVLSGGKTATFTIETNTTPDFFSTSAFGNQISYDNVSGIFGGIAGNASIGFGTFLFATLNIGGTPLGFTQYAGPDLFTLVNDKPVFAFGSYALNSITSGPATLTISAGAVPEPMAWAMMLGGFGMLGATLRYRRRKMAVSFA